MTRKPIPPRIAPNKTSITDEQRAKLDKERMPVMADSFAKAEARELQILPPKYNEKNLQTKSVKVEEFKIEKKDTKVNESKSSGKMKKVTQSSTSTLKNKPAFKEESGSDEKPLTQASSQHLSSFSDR